jgi:hypothetical protein
MSDSDPSDESDEQVSLLPITDLQPHDDEMNATRYAYPPELMPSGEETYSLLCGDDITAIYTEGESGEFIFSDSTLSLSNMQ